MAPVEQRPGLLEVAGHRPGDHRGVALGDEQAEHPAGAQHPADRGERGGRVVDDLEDAVAEHDVGLAGLGDVEQVAEVALLAGDPVGHPGLAGAPVEGGQGVGAGVDDGDPVAEPGERDGEAAGAAADVEDVPGPGAPVEHRPQARPHHGGPARGVARWRSLDARSAWGQP